MTEGEGPPALWAALPAAGSGRRLPGAIAKQHLPVAGRTPLERSLALLLAEPRLRAAVVALAVGDNWRPPPWCCHGKTVHRCRGGPERPHSVLNALSCLRQHGARDEDWVLVHDAARPLLRREDLVRLIERLLDDAVGGLLAVPVRDTLKRADALGRALETVDRTALWHAQTPQMFRLGPLREAVAAALAAGLTVTDEAAAMEHAGHHPLLVEGHTDNIKITSREDLYLAERLLSGDGSCA